MLIFALVIAVFMYAFWPTFRNNVDNYLRGFAYWAGEQWLDHRIFLVVTALLTWSIPTIILLIIGGYSKSMTSAIIFMILFPFWAVSSIWNGIREIRLRRRGMTIIIRPARRFLRFALSAVLIISVVNICFGFWSPVAKANFNQLVGDAGVAVANFFGEKSLQSEAQSGNFAWVTEDTVAILKKTGADYPVKKGSLVLVPSTKGKKADETSEGLVLVVFQNDHKSFGRGSMPGFIPSRLLDFNYKKAKAEEPKIEPKFEANPALETKVSKVSGEETWLVTYVSRENPGWVRVSLPPGRYTIFLNGNHEGTVWGKIDSEKFVVSHEMERWISQQSSLEVKVEGSSEGEKRIGIRRIG